MNKHFLFKTGLIITVFFISGIVAAAAELKVNDKAPSIRLRGMDNKLVFIDEVLKDNPVVISFFFADCVNCKKEMPGLLSSQKKYKDKVKFYLISTDAAGVDVVAPFIDANAVTIPVLLDKYNDIARAYGIIKYPSLFVIGRDQKIRYMSDGYHENNLQQLDAVLNKIK